MKELSRHFSFGRLLRFTFPSVVMLVFSSIYCIVDGLFVSNFVGKTALAGVNLIYPVMMILAAFGFMFGTGGSALIGRTLGEGEPKKANEIFTLLILVSAALTTFLSVLGIIFIRPIAIGLGAEGQLLKDSVLYGTIFLIGVPACGLQYEFQCLFVTAGKPKLGLYFTLASGISNMVLDALFVGVFSWGLAGAAWATVLSECIGGILPIFYFVRKNDSLLRITKTHFDGAALLRACTNGSSELLTNVSASVVSILYNFQLLHYAGEDGIAAYGVLMYVSYVFISMFIGYSVGFAPVVSFHFGAENHKELHSLFTKSLVIILGASLLMFAAAELLSGPLSGVFVGYDPELYQITLRGFRLYAFSYLFSGLAIMGSSFFTALNNGLISALLSFLRTVVFQVAAVLIFPLLWKLDGVWISIIFAEGAAALVTLITFAANRKKYRY